jgi:hypothetical protein
MLKELSFKERLYLKDDKDGSPLKGLIVVYDENMNELFVRKNLVVRTGREATIRKMFNLPDSSIETLNDLMASSVLLFGIGDGGAPSSDPFNPTPPSPSDSDLNTPIAFRNTSSDNPFPDAVTESKYTHGIQQSNGSTNWMKKTFENGSGDLLIDPSTDTVYNKLSLKIDLADARDTYINEIALYYARYDATAATQNLKYTKYKTFSRVTFPTEPIPTDSQKILNIDYYVYL